MRRQDSGTNPNYAVMDYYDGNTVTGLWNYAQHFALSDNSYGTNFGPSTSGAINVAAGNTYGAICGPTTAVYGGTPCTAAPGSAVATPGSPQPQGPETIYSDADPNYDICSTSQDGNSAAKTIRMGGQNIGDLLNRAGTTWGWFQYYASTANPQHLPPASVSMIGRQDQANHQYDLRDFWAAAGNGHLPGVSYLKAAEYQDGHAGYSDPLDEQRFLADTINRLERLPSWRSTAVVISYDDSDGWYDHQLGPIVTQSQTPLDTLTAPGACGANAAKVPGTDAGVPEQARCGSGPRLPLLVVSPFAKRNYVDSTFTNQSSVVRFIEDNWLAGQRIGNGSADVTAGTLQNMFDFGAPGDRRLYLDPATGQPSSGGWGH